MKAEARSYPKRLIEVDLPIRRISEHARREKSIRHGHISTLHIWWARRPLAACRAVICASLWPDPADPQCPAEFIELAKKEMLEWTDHERLQLLSSDSQRRFNNARKKPRLFEDPVELRKALLDFIADFANWDNSTNADFRATSQALTEAAHESLGAESGTRPLVVDPFAGGGSIPLEALRVGADAFASDLNPVPVLLNKVVLEYIPKYGQHLADEVRKWGEWIKQEAERELADFYPTDKDGSTPIAYLWARTIQCEGPGCGVGVPLIRSLWLAKKNNRSVALQLLPRPHAKRVDFEIIVKTERGWVKQDEAQDAKPEILQPTFEGTVARGSVTCPCCGYTTPVARIRQQLKLRHGGTNDARMICVVTTRKGEQGRSYRIPTAQDVSVADAALDEIGRRKAKHPDNISLVPDEKICLNEIRRISLPLYGMEAWGDMFTARQLLALTTVARLVSELGKREADSDGRVPFGVTATLLAMVVDRLADSSSSSVTWTPGGEFQGHTFTRQALAFVSDFAEVNPWCDSSGNWSGAVAWVSKVCEACSVLSSSGQVELASAASHPLPDDSANAVITDPPYYDAVPYAHLSDFFYVWLRRTIGDHYPELFGASEVAKEEEIVVDRPHELSNSTHDIAFYERMLTKAFSESRRILRPDGVCTIVFASKTTASWEAILKAVVDAGWIITGSWPIDTEREARIAAQGQARLASSVHLVCRPRENVDGSVCNDEVGDWSTVLAELPKRIHDWMPRLAEEGVVGADAIFACLGPALEIFSRYSRVEKANGEVVLLREYLEHVWAAVSKEALSVIFEGAATEGFEPDARLTAMWLWTIAGSGANEVTEATDEDDQGNNKPSSKSRKSTGFSLEYDAARKIAQGLGAHLEDLRHLVELSGETACLLPVAERTAHLFGKQQAEEQLKGRKSKKKDQQLDLFAELSDDAATEEVWAEKTVTKVGETTLDRVHQSMILFAANRGEALKRFLVEDGAGKDPKFWRLAQALSALYPSQTDEKRWVDGVLARKKGLGL